MPGGGRAPAPSTLGKTARPKDAKPQRPRTALRRQLAARKSAATTDAWQAYLRGQNNHVTPAGIHVAPALEFLASLV
jgi:hypothetical protein